MEPTKGVGVTTCVSHKTSGTREKKKKKASKIIQGIKVNKNNPIKLFIQII